MTPIKVKYPGSVVGRKELTAVYAAAERIFRAYYGGINPDAEAELTMAWDSKAPATVADYQEFYRENLIVPQELILWHKRSGYMRAGRAVIVGGIARALGLNTFCEYGFGVGADMGALMVQGFRALWGCDINRFNIDIAGRLMRKIKTRHKPHLFSVLDEKPEAQVGADFLYSSDCFEHILNLEEVLAPFIGRFKAAFIYAPFGSNEEQHQHTDYPASRFHAFMGAAGYQRVIFKLGVPPYVYIKPKLIPRLLTACGGVA